MLLILPILMGSVVAAANKPWPEDVSLVQLIANPKDYDGKFVRVIGFVNLEFEGNAIYLHQEDWRHDLMANSLWLDVSHGDLLKWVIYNKKYVLIEGTFNAKNHGHLGLFSGAIENISRWYLWDASKPRSIALYVASGVGLLLAMGACYRFGLKKRRSQPT